MITQSQVNRGSNPKVTFERLVGCKTSNESFDSAAATTKSQFCATFSWSQPRHGGVLCRHSCSDDLSQAGEHGGAYLRANLLELEEEVVQLSGSQNSCGLRFGGQSVSDYVNFEARSFMLLLQAFAFGSNESEHSSCSVDQRESIHSPWSW